MKTRLFLAIFVLLSTLPACVPASGDLALECAAPHAALANLRAMYPFPDHFDDAENPVKQGGEFDVMQYFDIFTHLSMRQGYVLDYVYVFDGMGGYPLLYVRPAGQAPYASQRELYESQAATEAYMDYVETDDSPAGYLEYILLAGVASKFYLWWHANYNDASILCGRQEVHAILSGLGEFGSPMPLSSRLRAYLLRDVAPQVVIAEETVEVRVVIFTQWGGFYRQVFTIQRALPHNILDFTEENLAPYDCGIMF
ncbi:MAG: hypothetical protein FJZ87_07870 [Chloroflexi bacterium]|nr:hypothetical protein [Chloroflexota bacterium]MBM3151489.1 hypothetical protein [Chloroflexota bacterium]